MAAVPGAAVGAVKSEKTEDFSTTSLSVALQTADDKQYALKLKRIQPGIVLILKH